MKRIPYGISNFEILRGKNYLYVDKTSYINILDTYAPYQFFIRPRRFGKSLFISMLENYYDINKKDKFDKLFGDLYIGKNPTEERNSFLVWKISFAGVDAGHGEEELRKSFNFKVRSSAKEFIIRYQNLLGENKLPLEELSAEMVVEHINMLCKLKNKQVFVLIDEYDNFANELITGGKQNTYKGILHGEGFVKVFYKALKDATADSFVRIFMTGVSPIMLDDLTSGFNITMNYTLDEDINAMLGFTRDELSSIMDEVGLTDYDLRKKICKDMTEYYNGYKFNANSESVFNPDMAMYFLNRYLAYNRYPKEMIDNNVKTDYGRVNQLAYNFNDKEALKEIMSTGETSTILVDRFNIQTMYSEKENFKSLLFYLGMLTIKEEGPLGTVLKIPNYVIKTIYWEQYFQKVNEDYNIEIQKVRVAVNEMRMYGSIEPLIELVKGILEHLSNRDLIQMDEKNVKMMILTLLGVDSTYFIKSEDENNKGYVDLMLRRKIQLKDITKFEWIIELKYIKESDRNTLEKVKDQGLKQLQMYGESKMVQDELDKEGLKKVLIIVVGKKDIYTVNLS
ncbi:ATP-binding protein [Clostridium estertheticum]|uniref:ATP-binding protein n=1 Tax=Clostridium estertheticum TaxID=238834 RepID=UPI001CF13936|nr:ATP-binding protein [Clostridium estertheticum]MCB2306071.1 ATP-binding protein [Clostridium estertheticum]MCB2346594.1 ATP-binding protein [Clostridium estertheticum]MCB2348958.1 ATP-binding protein [Clostridium estertheticum]WAG47601.1 ATP-binding protein [Clostridium estertheticum]